MSQGELIFELNAVALALATVIIRHRHSVVDNAKQYTVLELVYEVNSMPFNEIIRIHDIAILQQGLFEFKSILKKSYLHLELIQQQQKGEMLTLSFGGLTGHKATFDIKFLTSYSNCEIHDQTTLAELETKIISCANNLLTKLDKNLAPLQYTFQQVGNLYENFQNNKTAPQADFTSPCQQPRKTWLELQPRTQIKYHESIKSKIMSGLESLGFPEMNDEIARDMVSQVFSDNIRTIEPDSTTKRKLLLEEYRSSIASCPSVAHAVDMLKQDNVMYTDQEKKNVLLVFEKILSSVESNPFFAVSDGAANRLIAAKFTCDELKNPITKYSALDPYAVARWYISSQRQKRRPGRKINSDFEKEVWAGLVICQLLDKEPVIILTY